VRGGTRRGASAAIPHLPVAPLSSLVVALVLLVAIAPSALATDLYSRRAGFAKAKLSAETPTAVAIWKPARWKVSLNAAIRGWNRQARRQLFVRAWKKGDADVVLADGTDVGWAAACYDSTGAFDMYRRYARCTVFLPYHGDTPGTTWTLVHEMGHTLGFVDHVHASEYRRYVRLNLDPRVCDDPSHRAYSPYDGIMADCQSAPRFAGDAAALVRAGYAEP
jgi:hypothetical protein